MYSKIKSFIDTTVSAYVTAIAQKYALDYTELMLLYSTVCEEADRADKMSPTSTETAPILPPVVSSIVSPSVISPVNVPPKVAPQPVAMPVPHTAASSLQTSVAATIRGCVYVFSRGASKGSTCGGKVNEGTSYCTKHKKQGEKAATDTSPRTSSSQATKKPPSSVTPTVPSPPQPNKVLPTASGSVVAGAGADVAAAGTSTGIIFRIHRNVGKFYHPPTGFALRSSTERVVVSRIVDGQERPLVEDDVELIKSMRFRYDESCVQKKINTSNNTPGNSNASTSRSSGETFEISTFKPPMSIVRAVCQKKTEKTEDSYEDSEKGDDDNGDEGFYPMDTLMRMSGESEEVIQAFMNRSQKTAAPVQVMPTPDTPILKRKPSSTLGNTTAITTPSVDDQPQIVEEGFVPKKLAQTPVSTKASLLAKTEGVASGKPVASTKPPTGKPSASTTSKPLATPAVRTGSIVPGKKLVRTPTLDIEDVLQDVQDGNCDENESENEEDAEAEESEIMPEYSNNEDDECEPNEEDFEDEGESVEEEDFE